MVPKLKIHFWNISGYININKEWKETILKKILKNNSTYNFSKKLKVSNVSLCNFLYNKNSFVRTSNLMEIIKNLNVSKYLVEEKIIGYKDTSSKKPFLINFPYHLSPIDIRIVGVLVGDGNIHKTNGAIRWIQKDTTPLLKLLKKYIKGNITLSTKSNQITIPSFFKKISCYSLGLKPSELKTKKFMDQVLKLPKDYCLALLVAIIEDEGNIDPKNYSGINIRVSSKENIHSIKKICDRLEYPTSSITSYDNNGSFRINSKMFKIKILSDGIKKLGQDLTKLQKKYLKEIGFWKKENKFIKRWDICTSKRSEKIREGKILHQKIIKMFLQNKELSPSEISKILNIKYDRIYDFIRNMNKRGEITRMERGVYKIKN